MRKYAFLSRIAAVSFGILLSITIIMMFSKSGNITITGFLTGPFSSLYYLGTMLDTAALFMTAGLGAAAALINGEYNLGGEGQIYAGGFTAAAVLHSMRSFPPLPAAAAAVLCACGISAALSLISAVLKHYKRADVLLTSFLTSAAVIPIIDALIAGPFRNSGNLLSTQFVPENMRLNHILKPSPLSISIFAALILCLAFHCIAYRTAWGRKFRINGISKEFGRYCGYPQTKMLYTSLGISGALHGLAGFFAVCGTYYTCHSGFYSGMGWNALTAALVAGSNPGALIPSSLVLSWLFTAAGKTALTGGFSFNISGMIQGIMLFCISIKIIASMRGKKNDSGNN